MNASGNKLFDLASSYVHHTSRHLFVTGKAGTGKTTFLRHIQANTVKNTVVVAPTGVAAINAGGVTMHSFFQLPFGPFIPGSGRGFGGATAATDQHSLFKNIRFNNNKRKLLQELELLIIDEVSMVRADMLDAIDLILRHFRKRLYEPFGGVQVVYIGDLFQLPPVVANDEWEILSRYYASPFFFDAKVMEQAMPTIIELKKIYRQSEAGFINILNNVRNNQVTPDDLERLHRHYQPGFEPDAGSGYILLSTHNYRADEVNRKELNRLQGRQHTFVADVSGEFNEKSAPADKELQLKEGAQIMFIKNDKGEARRYYNGRIAQISRITHDGIFVKFPDTGDELQLEQETWKNVRYQLNENTNAIEEEEIGSFKQYPVRLAWAITIHKSQGLTFEKAIVDAGGAFAPGQVYVALSRLTSLDGLVLYSRINPEAIDTDVRVLAFCERELPEDHLAKQLRQEQQAYMADKLRSLFDWSAVAESMQQHHKDYNERQFAGKEKAEQWSAGLLQKVMQQKETAEKFLKQVHYLIHQNDPEQLRLRTEAAVGYFTKSITDDLLTPMMSHYLETKVKQRVKQYLKSLDELKQVFMRKKQQLEQAKVLAEALAKGDTAADALEKLNGMKAPEMTTGVEEPFRQKKEDSKTISLQMLQQGKTIAEIANERGLTRGTIEGHLIPFIATGEVAIEMFVSSETREAIMKAVMFAKDKKPSAIRAALGETFSYNDIKAVMSYMEKEGVIG
jgi:DNA-binding NarL/FixJ family response regulator